MSAAAIACCAAGRRGVGPGVKRRVLRSMAATFACRDSGCDGRRAGYSSYSVRLWRSHYNCAMTKTEQVQQDMVTAMRARDELRLSTLRLMNSALKNKEIEKRGALDEKEELQVFSTLIKQRKDSIEAFEKGNRPELAKKEAEEIVIIEATIAEMGSPTMKDMGTVMKNVMAKFAGARVDGKLVSETVKKELTGK